MSTEAGLIGQIAVQSGMITREQLRVATREQLRQPGRRLGEVLVELGYITEAGLEALLAAQAKAEERKDRAPISQPPPQKSVPEGVTLGAIALKRIVAPRPVIDGREAPRTREAPSKQEELARQKEEAARLEEAARRHVTEARAWLDELLVDAITSGASDVAVMPDQPVRLRRFGRWHDFTTGPVAASGTERLLLDLLPEDARATLHERGDACIAFDSPVAGRLRLTVHRQQRGLGGMFRHAGIGVAAWTPQELGLPGAMVGLTNHGDGLVLIAGPLGSGRSTSLSALIGIMSEDRSDHILLVQTPLEHVATPAQALLTTLEVGKHTPSVAATLRDAARYDADVLCIDDLPADAVDAALATADSEMLVIATVSALGVVRAVESLLDAFPEAERGSACRRVADTLRAVVAQRLVPAKDDGSYALAFEVLLVDDGVRQLIREGELGHLLAAIESGRVYGSCLLDDSLALLVQSGRISLEMARSQARNAQNFAAPRE